MRYLRIYFLLALLLMVGEIIQAQDIKEYYPLIPESGEKQWDIRRDFIFGESDYLICWFGDDIELDGIMYRTMLGILDNPYHTGIIGALREEDKKVYARWWSSGFQYYREEVLYYDFGLQVGDWFSVGDEDEPWYIMVESIDEVTMGDGSVRNAIVFNEGWGDEKETWIEGIGSLAGVTHRYDPNLFGSYFSHLQCYFEDDDLVWTGGECWDDVEEVGPSTPSTSSGTEGSGALIIFPNPSSETVHIEGIEVAEVQVFNSLGQLLQTIKGTNVINVSDLPKGISMLHITDACGNKQWAKVVVK